MFLDTAAKKGHGLDWAACAHALEHKLQAEGCSAAAEQLLLSSLVAGYADADNPPLAAYLADPLALQDRQSALQLRCAPLCGGAVLRSSTGCKAGFEVADRFKLMRTALQALFSNDCSLTPLLSAGLLCSKLWQEALAISTSSHGSQPAADSQQQDELWEEAADAAEDWSWDQDSPSPAVADEEHKSWQPAELEPSAAGADHKSWRRAPSADEQEHEGWQPAHSAAAATQRQLQQQPSQTLFVQLWGGLLNPWAILAAGCLPLLASTGLLSGAQCRADWTDADVPCHAECRAPT